MKQTLVAAAAAVLLGIGCTKTSVDDVELSAISEDGTSVSGGRKCASQELFEQKLRTDPEFAARVAKIEDFTARVTSNPNARLLADGSIEIPVVVNVVYNTTAQNISDAQIQSQIAVLNEDYGGTNADVNKTSAYQTVKAGDTRIKFVLSQIRRKYTTTTSWGTNDAVKSGDINSSTGGLSPTSPATTLNMWACNLGQGLLGYAQFPGGSLNTDGVVILYSAFGSRAKNPSGTFTSTYDLGRTATHEVGHYLNLRHIWGDRRCGDDMVGDTPQHGAANYGCPANGATSSCKGRPVMMWMNYMDYTDDRCMWMFSTGQKNRMQSLFVAGGARNAMGQP